MRGLLTFVLILSGLSAQDLEQGISAYKGANYQGAVVAFRRAVNADPNNINARLYLATALMAQYIPGPANEALAQDTQTEFEGVLSRDPVNKTALRSLASLASQQAQGISDFADKKAKLDVSAGWYNKLIDVDPENKEAYYSLGVIDWVNWYPPYQTTRTQLGMKPEDPGPFSDYNARQDLRLRLGSVIEDGIRNLQKALDIDAKYDDAMAYMNLLVRERADLRDTKGDYQADISAADEWVRKALEAKRAKAEEGVARPATLSAGGHAPPAGIPGSPYGGVPDATFATTSQRIRVAKDVQAGNLIRKVQAVYPPLARAARIQGMVRFTVIIDREGNVTNLQLVSGHPLLVEAARQAVAQWTYKPTLLNGQPVEVVTQIEVSFTLTE